MAETPRQDSYIKAIVAKIGLPTLIITAFWFLILVLGVVNGMALDILISDTIRRYAMNGVLVLAMVPAIQSGTGPNFALPVGIICGLISLVLAFEWGFMGMTWLLVTCLLAVAFSSVFGYGYGKLMNAVKGSEMTIATYTGFSIVAVFNLVWLAVPFKNPGMGWFLGEGLRNTIQLDVIGGAQVLNNIGFFTIKIPVIAPNGIDIPTGLLLVFFGLCFLVYLFFRSPTGIAISAGGINPMFARAAGLNIDRSRIVANVISTLLGAIGIILYSQSYGYAQLYDGPLLMAFPAVAAVLIGGATAARAKVSHVIIGTFLFQGLLTSVLPVFNKVFAGMDLSGIVQPIVQNGIILYALTQVRGGSK